MVVKCNFCQTEGNPEDYHNGFVAMIMPIPEFEDLIDKWGRHNWWENLEDESLKEEEKEELDKLSYYDQLLNTIGRGSLCKDCLNKENGLLNKYYPENEI